MYIINRLSPQCGDNSVGHIPFGNDLKKTDIVQKFRLRKK